MDEWQNAMLFDGKCHGKIMQESEKPGAGVSLFFLLPASLTPHIGPSPIASKKAKTGARIGLAVSSP
jgi:hypothetical protein